MKVLGLCFLIYDKINHEELWYNWLNNVDKKKYRIYIHYKNNTKLKYFEKNRVERCIKTKYAHVSLIHAHNILFRTAYKDGCDKIISLSQSCVPLKPFNYVYNFLTKDDLSHFNITLDQQGVFPRCNAVKKYYHKNHIQKSSNWFILNRNITKTICFNSMKKNHTIWKDIVSPEEHYFITEVYKNNLISETICAPNLSSEATTFTNWIRPKSPKNYTIITKDELDYLVNQPCLFGRKFDGRCIVIKKDIPILKNIAFLENIMLLFCEQLDNLTGYLSKNVFQL